MKKLKRFKRIVLAVSLGFIFGFFSAFRSPLHQLITKVHAVVGTLNTSVTSQVATGDITGQKFVDVGSASYFIDPNASGNSLIVAGNVGIGTTAPVGALEISKEQVGKALLILNQQSTDQNIFTASVSGSPKFTITNAGFVGIGTTTPGAALEVAGQVKITGGIPGAGKVLTSDANGLASWIAVSEGNNALLDGSAHTDTTAGTVTRGDVITGQGSTPKWTRLAKGSANQVLSIDSSGTDVTWSTPVSNYTTLVTLGADVASSASYAFQDITGMSFAVTSGTTYRFRATILYTASAASVGSRWAINGPASPTLLSYVSKWAISATADATTNANSYNAGADSNTSFSTDGNIARIEGIIVPSADGTLILRFAPETATANGIVVQAGSTLEYW